MTSLSQGVESPALGARAGLVVRRSEMASDHAAGTRWRGPTSQPFGRPLSLARRCALLGLGLVVVAAVTGCRSPRLIPPVEAGATDARAGGKRGVLTRTPLRGEALPATVAGAPSRFFAVSATPTWLRTAGSPSRGAAPSGARAAPDGGDLASRATDPTASPLSLSFIAQVTPDFYDRADGTSQGPTGSLLKLQPVMPFRAWGTQNILRITLPYRAGGPGEEGLEDIGIFDLVVLPQRWGRLGVGAVASFSAGTRDVKSHAAVGPAVGFVAEVSKRLNVGLFNQNLFSSELKLSQLQPIVAYQLGDGWSLTAGDLQWIYDWERDDFVSMPIGVQLGKILRIGKQPMRFAVNPQVNLKDVPGAPRTSVLFTATLLMP